MGKSPAGSPLTPLPQPIRERLLSLLDDAAGSLEEVVGRLAPDPTRGPKGLAGPAATRMWLGVLLRTAQELVSDLHPDRMQRKYGPVEPAEAAALRDEVDHVLAKLREAVALIE